MREEALNSKLDEIIRTGKEHLAKIGHIQRFVENGGQRTGAESQKQPQRLWGITLADGIQMVITLLMLLTLFYSIRSFNLSRKQLLLSQRPWVGADLKEQSPFHIGEAGHLITWQVYFKNFGNSPALRVRWHTRLTTFPGPPNYVALEKEIDSLQPYGDTEFTLFTGQEIPNTDSFNIPLTEEERKRILDRTDTVVLRGRIQYEDEFGTMHLTTFCVLYLTEKENFPEGWSDCPIKQIST